MKAMAILPMLLASCQTSRHLTLPNGTTYTDNGHLAGDTLVMIEPDGTTILRNKSWQDFLQAAGLAYAANRGAAVDIARSANSTARSLGAQKAATANNAINAEVQKLGIETAAEIEKLRIVTPINP
jgi:hypothetical protein